jgi:hypothetical protein
MRLATALLCAVFVVCACVIPAQVAKPSGDNAVVAFRQGDRARVELLAVTDSSLFFVYSATVSRAALTDVSQVHVAGYGARPGECVALGCVSLVNVVFCLDVIGHNAWYFALPIVPFWMAGAAWVRRDATRASFQSPMDKNAKAQLALHCRYPQGLTDAQWQELFGFYHQNDFTAPGDLPKP